MDKKETLELLDDNLKKIVLTNLKIGVEFKELSKNEIQEIIDDDKIIENIDSVIVHLVRTNYSWVSWIR